MYQCTPRPPPALCTVPPALLQDNVVRTFDLMKSRGFVRPGDLVVVVSDLRPREEEIIRSVQVRRVT